MNMTTFNAIRDLNDSLICVKTMIFERKFPNGHIAYATILCCVPKETFGKVKLNFHGESPRPESMGTFIKAIGFELMSPLNLIPLSRYENYLNKEGWTFLTTVKSAKGKNVKEAFELGKTMIEAIKAIRNKV